MKGRPASGYEAGRRDGGWSHGGYPPGPSYAEPAHDEHAEMVNLVKNAQRTSKEWGQAWLEYCTEFGNSKADPLRHNFVFLVQAVKTLGLPTGDVEKEKLVARIKTHQRGSIEARDAWREFCEKEGEGSRYDPGRYAAPFLVKAFTELESKFPQGSTPPQAAAGGAGAAAAAGGSAPPQQKQHRQARDGAQRQGGEWPAAANRGGPAAAAAAAAPAATVHPDTPNESDLTYEVKELQKTDVVAREAWIEYCGMHSDGTLDPKRFDDRFLRRALSFMRRATKLVAEIKTMTKAGGRVHWRRFCDDYGSSVYDPVLHNSHFLARAHAHLCSLEHAAAAPSGRGGGGGGGGGGARTGRGGGGGGGGGERGGRGSSKVEVGVVASTSLVTEFKEFQRANEGARDFWRDYCDQHGQGVYDPARHSNDFLRDAMRQYRYVNTNHQPSPPPKKK